MRVRNLVESSLDTLQENKVAYFYNKFNKISEVMLYSAKEIDRASKALSKAGAMMGDGHDAPDVSGFIKLVEGEMGAIEHDLGEIKKLLSRMKKSKGYKQGG